MRSLLVIDLGTTLFKFTLVDQAGRIVALARHPTPLTRPAPGQCELTIPDFEEAIVQGSQTLRTQAPDAWNAIEAVTFASQANTVALFDERERPLTPFLVWTDSRAAAHPEILAQLAAWPAPHARTGLPALVPTLAIAKLLWWRAQAPAIWNRTRRAAFLSDYLTAWLTGTWLCAGGIAGLSACCDIATLTWIPEALAVLGWTPEYFSAPVRGGALAGPVRAPVAARLGLPPG
ncbi:MAG: hypothetical protein K9N49_06935 [Candidatus Marinimicrobia bacterium]|nr:hypothetical protein [Candidatus Neomarinimicrobiota bacterium]